jgi:uncharacterized membrane protein YbhN (UPF0104 family)
MSPRARRGARWLVAIALVGVLVAVLNPGEILARLASANALLAFPAIAGLVGVHVVAAGAWRRLVTTLAGDHLDWKTAIRMYYAGLAVGTVTPGNIGADAYRVTALGDRASAGRLTRVVVVQRLTSLVAVAFLGVLGALALPIEGLGPLVLLLAAFAVAVAVAVLLLSTSASRFGGAVGGLLRRLGLDDAGSFQGRLRSALVDGLGFGLVFHATSLLLGLVLVAAVDPVVAAQRGIVVLAALAVARVSLALPISPNGIGVQEGVLGILFVQLGLPPETAIAAALLNRLALLLAAGIGAVSLSAGVLSRRPQPSRGLPAFIPPSPSQPTREPRP